MVELLERPPKLQTKSKQSDQVSHGSHDTFVKQAFGVPKVVEEFIATYLPKELQDKIDPKTAKLCPSEHYSNILGKGITDLLFKVKCKGGDGYISLLIEVQSTIDRNITHRVQQYMLRICEDHLRAQPRAKIPPVYPVLIYSGNRNYTAPKSFYELFTDPALAKQAFTQDLQLVNLKEIADRELQRNIYLGACFMLLKHKLDSEIFDVIRQLTPALKHVGKECFTYLEDMLYYLHNQGKTSNFDELKDYIYEEVLPEEKRDEVPYIRDIIAQRAVEQAKLSTMALADQFRREGELRGKMEGKMEGMIEVATRMLKEGLGVEMITKVTGLSKVELSAIGNSSKAPF